MLRSSVPLLALLDHVAVGSQCITAFPATENFSSASVDTPGTLTTGRSNLTAGDDLDRNVDNNGTRRTRPVPSATTRVITRRGITFTWTLAERLLP